MYMIKVNKNNVMDYMIKLIFKEIEFDKNTFEDLDNIINIEVKENKQYLIGLMDMQWFYALVERLMNEAEFEQLMDETIEDFNTMWNGDEGFYSRLQEIRITYEEFVNKFKIDMEDYAKDSVLKSNNFEELYLRLVKFDEKEIVFRNSLVIS